MRDITPLRRRRVLAGSLASVLPLRGALGAEEPALLVAGPSGSRLDRWAEPLATAVGDGLPTRAPLALSHVGGLDGVTGANAFEARGEPDGTTALLVPGAATLSWLVGETRAKFDPARWLMLWAATVPAVLVSRVQPERGSSLKVAASSPVGPELPFLLALDLAGIRAVLTSPQDADATLLQESDLASSIQAAAARGLNPLLTLGMAGPEMTVTPDPLLPAVPTVLDLARSRASVQWQATLTAAAFAARLDAGLVLPQLTPASTVATWRRACQPVSRHPEVAAEASRAGARMLSSSEAMSYTSRIAGDPGVLLSLRRWLASQHGWLPT